MAADRTGILSAQTGHNRMDRRHARKNYETLRQLSDGETLLEFMQRYKNAIKTLQAVGETVPSDEDQAIDFLEKLDQNKYAEFAANLHNDAANKQEMGVADTFPNTLATMYACASRYKIVVNKSRIPSGTGATAAVFTTTIEENAAATTKKDKSQNISEAEQQRRKAQSEKSKAAYMAKRGGNGGRGGGRGSSGRGGGGAGGRGGRGGRGGGSRGDEDGSERPTEGACYTCYPICGILLSQSCIMVWEVASPSQDAATSAVLAESTIHPNHLHRVWPPKHSLLSLQARRIVCM
mmetsp:Transcript_23739/g.33982  ORF Transcript_23739/g.33982 Transcript_23739/m.33982 type:complete len:293 (+) Transcript_23739:264-1142(+)